MAPLSGREIFLTLATVKINGTLGQSLKASVSEMEVTTKDSTDAWEEYLADEFEASGSINGYINDAATKGYAELWTAADTGAAVAFTYGYGVDHPGEELISGYVIISNLSRSDPKNSPSSWSCNYEVTGTPARGTSATTAA